MIVKILDNHNDVIEKLEGIVDNGTFNYKKGGLDVLGIKLFQKPAKLVIRFNKSIRDVTDGGKKYVYVRFDGKDYYQVDFEGSPDSKDTSIKDYINADTIADYEESSVLIKPVTVAEWINILLAAVLIIELIILYFVIEAGLNLVHQIYQPLNTSILADQQALKQNANLTIQNHQILEGIINGSIKIQ